MSGFCNTAANSVTGPFPCANEEAHMVDDILKTPALVGGQEALDINPFLGSSEAIRRLAQAATRLTAGDRHVVIVGELGTGKAALAHWLCRNSINRREPFIEVDCVRLRRSHAALDGRGEVPRASIASIPLRGTVIIHHVEKMDSNTQARFLRAASCGSSGAGESDSGAVNLRLLMTRQESSEAGNCRNDLAEQLSSVRLWIPPLRQRREDLPVIAFYILQQLSRELGAGDFDLARGAIRLLQSYSWPGNIRELENAIGHACMMAQGSLIDVRDFPETLREAESRATPVTDAEMLPLAELAQRHARRVLDRVDGNKARAAEILGVSRSTLYRLIADPSTDTEGLSYAGQASGQ